MQIREAHKEDSAALCVLLNKIIEIGGTTAYQTPLNKQEFEAEFISGADCVSCFVAEDAEGQVLGFQALYRHSELPENCVDIATFAHSVPRVKGVGMALFTHTAPFARTAGITAINATIRADNKPGLAYYSRLGFKDYQVAKAVPLNDGTPTDRISKRYVL